MTKQRNRRLLAVLMAVCVILASGPVALATQAAAAFAVSSVEPGHEHGDNKENGLGVGAAHEEPGVALEADNGQGTQSNQVSSSAGEEPGETLEGQGAQGYKEPGDTPGEQSTESDESSGYPDEESKEDSDNGTNDGNGNPEEPEIDEEKDEEPAGSFESELEPAKAALTVTHILLLDDGDEELMEIVRIEDLYAGTTVQGCDFKQDYEGIEFLYSTPEELVLDEDVYSVSLFYKLVFDPAAVDDMGDNPDGLEEPQEIPAPDLYYPDRSSGEGSFGAWLFSVFGPSSLSKGFSLTGFPDDHDNIEPPNPGSLALSKTATPVEGTTNKWQVTLTLTGIDLPTTSDIVLVIDTSGSMGGWSGRMAAAKSAATQFVNSLLNDPDDTSTRIAVVSFANGVTVHQGGFKDVTGKQDLLDAIGGLSAGGGTFTQAGIRQARILLESPNSTADHKNIVFLSDGEPTYSYAIDKINSNRNPDYFVQLGGVWYTRDDLAESKYDYLETVGNGTSMTTRIASSYYYHHGHSAIAESRFAKESGVTVYSVGLSAGTSGQDILDRVASPGKSYEATNDDLTAIFQAIAGSISFAATNAKVTDPVGEMFSIPGITAENYEEKIAVSLGTSVIYDTETETIEWSVPFVSETNPATMTYIVEIDPSAGSGVVYPTNGETYVDYTNALDVPARRHFDPIPEVGINAGTIVVYYYRVNSFGQPVNSEGVPVGNRQAAELHHFTFKEGTNLELNVPYDVYFYGEDGSVTSIVIDGKTYDYYSAGDQNPTEVTLTPAVPSGEVWFACMPGTMMVSAENVVKTYDGNSYGVSATSNVADAVIKYWNESTEAYDLDVSPAIANVSGSPLTVKFQASHPNYVTATGEATVTINPAEVTITVGNASKVFGEADPVFTGTVVGLVAEGDLGTVSYSRTNTAEGVGLYENVLDATFTSNTNYTVVVVPGDFTITAASTMTVSAENVVKTYDGNSYGVSATSNVADAVIKYWNESTEAYDLDVSPAIANVSGSPLTVKFQASHPNYVTATGEATVTINPAEVTITVGNASKVFGEADPVFTGTVVGLVAEGDLGTVSYSRTNTAEGVGLYENVLDATFTSNTNYTVVVVPGDFTITAASTMTVSAENVVKTYDGNSYGVSATSNVADAVIKYWNESTEAYDLDVSPAIANVSGSPLTVKFQASHPNYVTATGEATVTINPAEVTITVGNASKVFGEADPVFTGTVVGLVAEGDLGTVSYSRTNTAEGVGLYENVLDATFTSNTNYTVVVVPGDFTITAASTMTVSAENVVKTYDGNSYGVSATSNVADAVIKYWNESTEAYDLDVSPAIANVSGSPLTVKFQASHPNYVTATGEATVTINPAEVTITVGNASKVFGEADPVFTGTVVGLVAEGDLGTVSYSRTNTAEGVGLYENVLDATFTSNTNYTVVVVPGDFTITAASTMTVSAENVVKTYDGNSYGVSATSNVADAVIKYWNESTEAYDLDVSPAIANVSGSPLTVKFQASHPNYVTATGEATVTINPAEVTITVGNASKVFGEADPVFTGTVVGLVAEGDLGTVSYSRTNTAEGVGLYENVLDATFTSNTNYTVVVVPGDFTITAASTMTVSAENVVKTYDGNSYGVSATSNVADAVIKYWNESTEAYDLDVSPAIANVSGSPLTVKFQASHPNYVTATGEATVTINPAEVTITVGNASKVFGEADPVFTGTVVGLVAEGDLGTVSYSRTNTAEGVGLYENVLDATFTSNTNYTVVVVPGDFTITAASTMTVSAENVVKTYDGNSYGVSATSNVADAVIKYWNESTEAYDLDVSPAIANVSGSPLTVKFQASHPNYVTATGEATVTINPAEVTITVGNASKVFGEADPVFTGTVVGLVAEGDLGTVSYSRTNTAEGVGLYENVLDATFTSNTNYTVVVVPGDFTITAASTMTVSAENVVKTYDGNSYGVSATSNVADAVIKYWNESTEAYDLDVSPAIANVSGSPLTVKFQASHPNYVTATGEATVTINPAEVTITVGNASKVFGEADPVFTGTVVGLVAEGDLGTVSYSRTNTAEGVGLYENVLDATFTSNTNYTVVVVPGDFTITAASTMTVSAENVVKTYDGNSYGVSATSNVADAVIKYWNESTEAYDLDVSPAIANVSGSPLTVKFQASHPNYVTATGEATVTINPAEVTITVGNASKVFGEADPVFTGTVVGLVAEGDLGTVSYSRTNTAEGVGLYENVLDATFTSNTNYTVVVVPGDFTITAASTMTVSAENVVKTYDGNSYGVSATSNVADAVIKYWNESTEAYDLDVSPAIANVSGSPLTVKFQASHPNYVTATGEATVTINPAEVTITVGNASKVFGEADPVFTGTVVGLVAEGDLGTVSYSRTNTAEGVGLYENVLDATFTSNTNYTVVVVPGDFTITAASTMTVSAENVVKTYDGNSYGVSATSNVADAVIKYWNESTEAYDLDVSPAIANVSGSPLTVKFQASHPNYVTATGEATVTINPAEVTITVGNASKVFGEADPVFTGTVVGLVAEGDLGTVSYSRTNTAEGVGLYENVLDATFTSNTNYTVVVVPGDFTITAASTMTVSAENVVKTYDGNSYGVSATSNVADAVIKYWNESTEAYDLDVSPAIANVSGSPLTVKFQASHPNYVTATGEATVTINPAEVTITVGNASKVFGTADPAFTGTVVGLVAEGDLGTVSYSRTNTAEGVGLYENVLDATFTSNTNYTVVVVPGDFTITAATGEDLNITGYTGVYDAQSHSIVVVNVIDGDTVYYSTDGEDWLEYNPEYVYVGEYLVYVKVTNSNYNDRTGSGTVEITARPIEITAASDTKTYDGTALSNSDYSLTGGSLPEADRLMSVTVTGSQTAVGSSANVASLAVIMRGGEIDVTGNYDITFIDGTLTVTERPYEPIDDPEIPLTPVLNKEDHFAYIHGYPDNTVRPEGNITREEVAAVFFRLLEANYRDSIRATVSRFPDVHVDRWSSKHIATLAVGAILEGYPDGTFRPGNYITRAELATIAARFDELSFLETNVFPDVEGHWAEKYINSAAKKGWVEGYPDGTFKPDQYITRAEFVTLVNRVLERRVRAENILPKAREFPDLKSSKWYYEAMQEAINSHLFEREPDGYETWLEITDPGLEW